MVGDRGDAVKNAMNEAMDLFSWMWIDCIIITIVSTENTANKWYDTAVVLARFV